MSTTPIRDRKTDAHAGSSQHFKYNLFIQTYNVLEVPNATTSLLISMAAICGPDDGLHQVVVWRNMPNIIWKIALPFQRGQVLT